MFISNAYSAVNAAYTSKANSTNAVTPVATVRNSDVRDDAVKVTISSAGRQAAYAEGANATSGAHPLEMYQVPDWYAQYMFEVPGQLGTGANWFSERHPEAASATMAERSEYAELIQGHYQATLDANGIQGVEAHYRATILDQGSSDLLRQQMSERVQADSRLVALMTKMTG